MKKSNFIVIAMLLMGLAFFVNIDTASAANSTIYVNASGNDAWDGQNAVWNGTSGPKLTIKNATGTVAVNGIVNVANGNYTGASNRGIIITKNMTIKGQSKDGTIINGSNNNQIFIINSGVNVTLLNLTIANAKATNSNGGAIRNNGGNLTVNNCSFKSNSATRTSGSNGLGGAIYSTGSLTVVNSVFTGNTATRDGAAIYSTGSSSVVNSVFTGNTATRDGAAIYSTGSSSVVNSVFSSNSATRNGGAIYSTNTLNITGSNFNSDTAVDGGAIYSTGNLALSGSSFSNNSVSSDGGAIYNTGTFGIVNSSFINNSVVSGSNSAQGGAIYSSGPLNIVGSIFINNSALGNGGSNLVVGGAISIQNSLNITRSTFINNSAGSNVGTEGFGGGALYIGTNAAPITNVNISESNFINNSATYGGAIWMNAGISTTYATITKSTFTGNRATNGGAIRNWGYLKITNSDFSNNTATANGGAIYNYQGTLLANFNRFLNDTGNMEIYLNTGTINATNNWWGSNVNASSKVSGGVDVSTWLVLRLTASPSTVLSGNTSTITADLNHDQNGVYYDPADGHIPDGTVVIFTTNLGNISSGVMVNGTSTVTLNAGTTPGVATVNATVNGYTNNTKVTIVSLANIVINQTVNTPVNVGDKVTFLVTATNNGPNTATNINIRDIIPTGLTGVVVTPSVGTYNSTTGIWTIPSLLNGSSAVLNITGTVTAAMAGKTTNNTATEISQTENSTQLPSSTLGVYTKLAEVEFHQTATPRVNVGGLVTYIVYVTNYGPDIVTYTVIEDFVPAGLLNATVTPSAGTYSNGLWTINFLDVGQTVTLTISGIAGPTMAGKNTTNKATKVAEREYDPSTLGEFTTADVYTNDVNLVVTNTANSDRLNVGQTGIFTVTVTNNGPDNATNIQINDLLPEGFTPSWDMGDYDGSVWTIASLASGETATLTLTCNPLYDALAGTDIVNRVSGTLEEYPFNFSAEDATIHVNMVNVVITQTGSYNKNNVTFIVTVRNNGPDNATNINIENRIIGDLINIGIIPSVGTINSELGIWTIPFLENGSTATLTITGSTVLNSVITNFCNRISQDEYNPETAESTVSVYVPSVNIIVNNYPWKSSVFTYNFKQQIVMLVQVNNLGNSVATGINVKYVVGNAFKVVSYNLIQPGTLSFDSLTNTFNWTIDSLNGGNGTIRGSYAAFSVVLESLQAGSGGADFRLNSTIMDCDQTNIGATKTRVRDLIINPAADIQVDQTVSNINPITGDYVTIMVKVKNNGPSTATGVVINDLLPTGLVVDDDPNTSITYSSGTNYVQSSGNWTINTLNNGDEVILTIIARVTADPEQSIINKAYRIGTPAQYDWNTGNDAYVSYIIVKTNSIVS